MEEVPWVALRDELYENENSCVRGSPLLLTSEVGFRRVAALVFENGS